MPVAPGMSTQFAPVCSSQRSHCDVIVGVPIHSAWLPVIVFPTIAAPLAPAPEAAHGRSGTALTSKELHPVPAATSLITVLNCEPGGTLNEYASPDASGLAPRSPA